MFDLEFDLDTATEQENIRVVGGKIGRQKLLQAISYVACLIGIWTNTARVDGSEFVGGSITGRLLFSADSGILAIAGSLVVLWWFPRIAAVLGITASLLSLPLLLYFVFPGLFQSVFKGN
jgi:hypothetical protein